MSALTQDGTAEHTFNTDTSNKKALKRVKLSKIMNYCYWWVFSCPKISVFLSFSPGMFSAMFVTAQRTFVCLVATVQNLTGLISSSGFSASPLVLLVDPLEEVSNESYRVRQQEEL